MITQLAHDAWMIDQPIEVETPSTIRFGPLMNLPKKRKKNTLKLISHGESDMSFIMPPEISLNV